MLHICEQSRASCRTTVNTQQPARSLAELDVTLQILSEGHESVLRQISLLFIQSCTYNFNDLSCKNTKSKRVSSSSAPCPTADPWRPELVRGRSQESGSGGSRCSFPRKLNNFKVHLVKRLSTYFNTSFTCSLSLLVGAPPLYVCLRQCERVKVCVILQRISTHLHSCNQKKMKEGIPGIKCIV